MNLSESTLIMYWMKTLQFIHGSIMNAKMITIIAIFGQIFSWQTCHFSDQRLTKNTLNIWIEQETSFTKGRN